MKTVGRLCLSLVFFLYVTAYSFSLFRQPSMFHTQMFLSMTKIGGNEGENKLADRISLSSLPQTPTIVSVLNSQTEGFLQYFSSKYKLDIKTSDLNDLGSSSSANAIQLIDVNSITENQNENLKKVRLLSNLLLRLNPFFCYLLLFCNML